MINKSMMMKDQPLVSIICLVFNHGKYLRQCLDGFVCQKTSFPFEIIIHDAASTDNSQEIIKEYVSKYPGLFVPILQTENQYSKGVRIGFTFMYPKARGKYIAECEGDDYWTDPLKLQKEVDFLESNPDYGLVYTGAKVLQEKTGVLSENLSCQQNYVSLLTNEDRIITLTTCFRKELLKKFHQDITCCSQWLMGDLPLWLYFSFYSKIKWLPEITGVYRFLQNSASHSSDINKKIQFSLSAFECRKYFDERFSHGQYFKQIATFEFNDLCKISICYNKSIFKVLFDFVRKNSLFSLKNIIKIALYSTKIGRKYHVKKYGKTVL